MPDATVSLIERTIQEADSFCPCNHVPHRGNVCCGQGVCILASCKYPGHAAIRRAVRVALEEAAKAAIGSAPVDFEQCTSHGKGRHRAAEGVRALMPEEVKQHE